MNYYLFYKCVRKGFHAVVCSNCGIYVAAACRKIGLPKKAKCLDCNGKWLTRVVGL